MELATTARRPPQAASEMLVQWIPEPRPASASLYRRAHSITTPPPRRCHPASMPEWRPKAPCLRPSAPRGPVPRRRPKPSMPRRMADKEAPRALHAVRLASSDDKAREPANAARPPPNVRPATPSDYPPASLFRAIPDPARYSRSAPHAYPPRQVRCPATFDAAIATTAELSQAESLLP